MNINYKEWKKFWNKKETKELVGKILESNFNYFK